MQDDAKLMIPCGIFAPAGLLAYGTMRLREQRLMRASAAEAVLTRENAGVNLSLPTETTFRNFTELVEESFEVFHEGFTPRASKWTTARPQSATRLCAAEACKRMTLRCFSPSTTSPPEERTR
eukprot:scaffold7757_cov229-Pinguiococcus_pyrenoidosus.AAC.2